MLGSPRESPRAHRRQGLQAVHLLEVVARKTRTNLGLLGPAHMLKLTADEIGRQGNGRKAHEHKRCEPSSPLQHSKTQICPKFCSDDCFFSGF